ncbi:MAG: hypothetical protein RL410_704, partial [Actinomycetota bacterium]
MKKVSKAAALAIASVLMFGGVASPASAVTTGDSSSTAVAHYKKTKKQFSNSMKKYKATKFKSNAAYKAALKAWKVANADRLAARKAVG